jgi:hypothetical protein
MSGMGSFMEETTPATPDRLEMSFAMVALTIAGSVWRAYWRFR